MTPQHDKTSEPDSLLDEAHLLSVLGPGNYQRLADASSLTRPHVSRILRGVVPPSPDHLSSLAAAACVSPSDVTRFISAYAERRDLPDLSSTSPRRRRPQIDGGAIRDARTKKGLTQDDVAALAGIHHTYVSQIEGGRTPSDDILERVVEVVGLDADDAILKP